MNKQKKTVIIYCLIIFLCGAGIGLAASCYIFRPPSRAKWQSRFFNKVKTELSLNNEQSVAIEKIVTARAENFKELRNKFKSDFDVIHKQMRIEIETELNDEQKIKFQKMVEKYERKKNKKNKID